MLNARRLQFSDVVCFFYVIISLTVAIIITRAHNSSVVDDELLETGEERAAHVIRAPRLTLGARVSAYFSSFLATFSRLASRNTSPRFYSHAWLGFVVQFLVATLVLSGLEHEGNVNVDCSCTCNAGLVWWLGYILLYSHGRAKLVE